MPSISPSRALAASHPAHTPWHVPALPVVPPALPVGALCQRQRRLVPCIALHAAFNAIWLMWAGFSIDLV